MSTESIASPQPSAGAPSAPACATCGAPLAADQRYCLECGERSPQTSEFLRSGAPLASGPPAGPPQPPGAAESAPQSPRNNTVSLLGGVGVLLLAMGVGVLIGRSGGSSKSPASVQVVTQAGGASAQAVEAAFTADWPSGTKGYTVQIQTLPIAGTTIATVAADKTAALGKGAGSVGALKSSEYSSLGGENYVIYSGVYHNHGEAQKALAGLAKKFPGAKVIEVSDGAGAAGSSKGASSNPEQARKRLAPGVGQSLSKPAPPSVLQGPSSPKGKKAEEESKNIPDVVSTG